MSIEQIMPYLQVYGYWIILLILFCGIVGIPAPEESFMVFLGMLCGAHQLNYSLSASAAAIGAVSGMITAYWIGRTLGQSFISRFGRYIKVTPERWEKVESKFRKSGKYSLLIGFYLPGLRQLNPYMAGTSRFSFPFFLVLSAAGSAIWVITFVTLGFFLGDKIHVAYIPLLAAAFVAILLLYKWFKKKNGA
ncbi:DedA family protein [Peribacillus sp. B-H-3]|uniref:DedA family protein n=1 Tax=Peribacillus sp. B-H-3 TaxID=3400420 RepID=UPI003B02624E